MAATEAREPLGSMVAVPAAPARVAEAVGAHQMCVKGAPHLPIAWSWQVAGVAEAASRQAVRAAREEVQRERLAPTLAEPREAAVVVRRRLVGPLASTVPEEPETQLVYSG